MNVNVNYDDIQKVLTLVNANVTERESLRLPQRCPKCKAEDEVLHKCSRCGEEWYDAEECQHDEHDHGICMDCGADLTDKLAGQAEAASDAKEDR